MAINNVWPDSVTQSYIGLLIEERAGYTSDIRRYRSYANGDQKIALTDKQKEILKTASNSIMNICPTVLTAKASRLKIRGIRVYLPDEPDPIPDPETGEVEESLTDKLNSQIQSWWEASCMDLLSSDIHWSAGCDGDAYLFVDYNNKDQRPCIHLNHAYEGDSGTDAVYSQANLKTPLRYIKRWTTDQPLGKERYVFRRLNVYFPNRVEKYISGSSPANTTTQIYAPGWRPYEDEWTQAYDMVDEGGAPYRAGVTWWTDTGAPDGEPIGFPVVHFAANSNGGSFGRSFLADVVPDLQDDLNLARASLKASALMAGFNVGVLITDDDFTDDEGVEVEPSLYPGSTIKMSVGSQYGQLSATNLTQLIEVKNATLRDISAVTNTPLSWFNSSGQVSAEGTLQQQEAPLISEVQKLQKEFGLAYKRLIKLMLRLELVFGSQSLIDAEQLDKLVIVLDWEPVETRDRSAEMLRAVQLKRDLGVSREAAWSYVGYTQQEIDQMKRELEEEAQASHARLVESQLMMVQAGRAEEIIRGTPNANPAKVGEGPPPTGPPPTPDG